VASLNWLILGLAALGLLALGVDFDGLMPVAVAALLMSILLSVVTTPLAASLQLLIGAGLTLLLLSGLQHWSKRRRQRALPPLPAAEHAIVISGFDADDHGRVQWLGQSWMAINLMPEQALRRGDTVLVMGREGNALQVNSWPTTAQQALDRSGDSVMAADTECQGSSTSMKPQR